MIAPLSQSELWVRGGVFVIAPTPDGEHVECRFESALPDVTAQALAQRIAARIAGEGDVYLLAARICSSPPPISPLCADPSTVSFGAIFGGSR